MPKKLTYFPSTNTPVTVIFALPPEKKNILPSAAPVLPDLVGTLVVVGGHGLCQLVQGATVSRLNLVRKHYIVTRSIVKIDVFSTQK